MTKRQCLCCGMTLSVSLADFTEKQASQCCPKCDSDLLAQTDGTCLTRDIAHQHESIAEASGKLDDLINDAYSGYYKEVRVVVGGGLIKDEVLSQLYFYEQQGYILSYTEDGQNRGAILIQIRNTDSI